MNNKLKFVLITLIVILISGVSFLGIYVENLNAYTNVIKDYMLARNLKGSRVVQLKAELDEKDETLTESETEEDTVEGQTVKEIKFKEEDLKDAKRILEKRLKKLGSEDYVIEQNIETGDTTVYLNEDELTDTITGYLTSVGEFKIVDAEDSNNILITNEHLKNVKVGYVPETTGTSVYLSIEFNKEGKQKLEDISNTYITEVITDETQNQVESEQITNNNEEESKTLEKQVTLMIDDTEIMTTSFDETVSNGILQMSIGSASTSIGEIQEYITQANGIAVILNAGKMPIEYTIETNEYVSIDENMVKNIHYAIAVLAVIALIACTILVVKFKVNGFKAAISFIGMIAIFLLLARYTNVYIAMESSIAFIVLIVINTYLYWLILENYKENKILPSILNAYKKSVKISIPVLIIAVVLCFISWTPISSIGMLLFWGLISMVIANFAITLPMLSKNK